MLRDEVLKQSALAPLAWHPPYVRGKKPISLGFLTMAFLIEFLTKGRLFGLQVGVRVWGGNIQTVADLIGTFPGLCEALWGLGV